MKYQVSARRWDEDLQAQFGKEDLIVEMTDEQIVAAIMKHGRASIEVIEKYETVDGVTRSTATNVRKMRFDNDYD